MGHPLDTVKVNLQTQDPKNPIYKNTLDCLKKIAARDGLKGIYRGVSSPLSGVAAINAVVFGVYGNSQRNFKDPNSYSSHFVAGTLAGLSQSFLCSPIELVKTRAQIRGDSVSPWNLSKQIYAQEGYRGIFKGLNLTICREIPAFSTYFLTYEFITRNCGGEPVSTWSMLFAGGMAGVVSWIFCYPMDVLKSRYQVDGMDSSPKYKNALDCLKKSIAAEGHGFLFRGLAPTLVRAFPVNAACFTVVTWTIRICQGEFKISLPESEIIKMQDVQIL